MSYSDWKDYKDFECPKCGIDNKVKYRTWESSDGAHEDTQYNCDSCGKNWWVEGSDS